MRYIPELDGIRAIAVMLVLVFHAQAPFLTGGFLGVDVFFVLSGYLITAILLREADTKGRIRLRRFYIHRLARLTPPLLLLLVIYLAIAPQLWPRYPWHLRDALISVTYLSDYGRALFGVPNMLRHTWSLAVEEHFYLLWPAALIFIAKLSRRHAVIALAAAYVLATGWRIYSLGYGDTWYSVYCRFDTRLSGLILGGLLAAMIRDNPQTTARPAYLLAAVAIAIYILQSVAWHNVTALQLGMISVEVATALVILSVVNGPWSISILRNPVLTYIGRISYGIYLFHYPVVLYLRGREDWLTVLAIGSLFAFAMAALSYHTIEAAVRRWRSQADITNRSLAVNHHTN